MFMQEYLPFRHWHKYMEMVLKCLKTLNSNYMINVITGIARCMHFPPKPTLSGHDRFGKFPQLEEFLNLFLFCIQNSYTTV